MPVFALTRGCPLTGYKATKQSQDSKYTIELFSNCTIIFDTINGPKEGYDNFIVNALFDKTYNTHLSSNLVSFYVPYLEASNSGDYYCNYIDGSSENSTTGLHTGGPFTLQISTKINSANSLLNKKQKSLFKFALFALLAQLFFNK